MVGLEESCTKDSQEQIAMKVATNYINKSKWKISSFKENTQDVTDHFTGYVFAFNTDNTVTATRADDIVKGSWSTTTDDSKTKMNISFPSAPFNELNEDWVITNGNASTIELKHESGGNGGIDYLTFVKI